MKGIVKKNKGFSLVELIIVIAIMAILIGVMAPQLIIYIEKTKVSADTQYLDTWRTAITDAMADPYILNSKDPKDMNQINHYLSSRAGVQLGSIGGSTIFCNSILETVGAPEGTNYQSFANNINSQFKSKPAHATGNVMVGSDGIRVFLWIDNSDRYGKGNSYTCNDIDKLESSGVIYVGN